VDQKNKINKELYGIKHIAFIMDGNGRWAKLRGKPREFGHKQGAQAFREVVLYCRDIGIKYVTVYAFSTENWKRPQKEVDSIMRLLGNYLSECERKMDEFNVSFRFIGNTDVLDDKLKVKMRKITEMSDGKDLVLNIAINYGGRDEIVHAVNKLIGDGYNEISAEDINKTLYTAGCPDPDLIVRTAGEARLSNFLLWQASYSEFYRTETLWPDFGPNDVDAAIEAYGKRKRRFGGI